MTDMSDLPERGDGVRMCRDCGKVKPLTDFHVSPKRKFGRGSYCKECFNQRSKRSYAKRVMEKDGRQVREYAAGTMGHPAQQRPAVKARPGRDGQQPFFDKCQWQRPCMLSPLWPKQDKLSLA